MKKMYSLLVGSFFLIIGSCYFFIKRDLSVSGTNPFFMVVVEEPLSVANVEAAQKALGNALYEAFSDVPREEVETFFKYKSNRINCTLCYCTQEAQSQLEKLKNIFACVTMPSKVILKFKGELDFFGSDKSELVAYVDDFAGVLNLLHNQIRAALPEKFVDSSFSYVPHITLLRIEGAAISAFAEKNERSAVEMIEKVKSTLLAMASNEALKCELQASALALLDAQRTLHKA